MHKELIASAAQALHIQAVYLREATVNLKKDFVPQYVEADLPLIPQYRAGPTEDFNVITAAHEEKSISFKTVIFPFSAGVRLVDHRLLQALEENPEAEDDAVYVEITADFSAHYRLKDGANEDDLQDALGEFSQFNVGYHVWPYWRELVQSTCARIGIPPIPIPMYQLPCATEEP